MNMLGINTMKPSFIIKSGPNDLYFFTQLFAHFYYIACLEYYCSEQLQPA